MESIELSCDLEAPPEQVYVAWLSAEGHSAMTGSPATVDEPEPGAFTAWEGYIRGRTLEAQPGALIRQAWRTNDFEAGDADSLLELRFEPRGAGTRLVLKHAGLPDGTSEEYSQGWMEYYFEPMKVYFSR